MLARGCREAAQELAMRLDKDHLWERWLTTQEKENVLCQRDYSSLLVVLQRDLLALHYWGIIIYKCYNLFFILMLLRIFSYSKLRVLVVKSQLYFPNLIFFSWNCSFWSYRVQSKTLTCVIKTLSSTFFISISSWKTFLFKIAAKYLKHTTRVIRPVSIYSQLSQCALEAAQLRQAAPSDQSQATADWTAVLSKSNREKQKGFPCFYCINGSSPGHSSLYMLCARAATWAGVLENTESFHFTSFITLKFTTQNHSHDFLLTCSQTYFVSRVRHQYIIRLTGVVLAGEETPPPVQRHHRVR